MKNKFAVIFAMIGVFTLSCFASGCTFRTRPEVTGVADDGLYLYSGNMRYTSDYANGEPLLLSVDIDGLTYNCIRVSDSLYVGDDAYMSVSYYENDTFGDIVGSCIIKYNVADKTQELIYNYALDNSNDEKYLIKEILSVSKDGLKQAVVSELDYILLINGGEIIEELPADVGAYTYNNDLYVFSDYRKIVCKSWDGEEVSEFESLFAAERMEIYGGRLYLRTYKTYRGEKWRNEDWIYNCNGMEVYDLLSGDLIDMFDPSIHETCYFDLQTGIFICGKMSARQIKGNTHVFAVGFDLYLFNGDTFEYYADFENDIVDWTYASPKIRGDYIIFRGCGEEEGAFRTYLYCYFNLKTRTFEEKPELPVEKRGEFGGYYFYVDEFGPLIITAPTYKQLHRVNKSTGKDDIMAYTTATNWDDEYLIDIVRNY